MPIYRTEIRVKYFYPTSGVSITRILMGDFFVSCYKPSHTFCYFLLCPNNVRASSGSDDFEINTCSTECKPRTVMKLQLLGKQNV